MDKSALGALIHDQLCECWDGEEGCTTPATHIIGVAEDDYSPDGKLLLEHTIQLIFACAAHAAAWTGPQVMHDTAGNVVLQAEAGDWFLAYDPILHAPVDRGSEIRGTR